MTERYGGYTENTLFARHGSRYLQEALATYEVGMEVWAERVPPPGNTRSVESRPAQQRVVENGTERHPGGQLIGDGAANDGEDFSNGDAVLGEGCAT